MNLFKHRHEHQFGWHDIPLSEIMPLLAAAKGNCTFRICNCGAIQIFPEKLWPTLSVPDQKIILEKIGEILKGRSPKRTFDVIVIGS